MKKLVGVVVVLGIGAALLARTFQAAPLPRPPAFTGALPPASPPPTMAIYQLPTGVTHRSSAFAYRGGTFSDKRDFGMAAVLVEHPGGDLLIDTGLGRTVATQVAALPFWFRAVTSYTADKPAADQLDEAGYDRKKLSAILLTHAHWDHVSGAADFPDTPVWVDAAEHRFIHDGGWISETARKLAPTRLVEYAFDGPPYLGFPASHDVYGDGSIVIVPAPGHTPGSVIVFLALPSGQRYAMIGDLAWQREGILEREERPWVPRTLGDIDAAGVRHWILHMYALARRFPQLTLVPAHDSRGFATMPRLPSAHN